MAQFAYITATSQIKVGATRLKGIIAPSGTDNAITIYNTSDGNTTNTTAISTMTFAVTPATIPTAGDEQGMYLDKGLYVVVAGTSPKFVLIYD